jgi:hypothetical protein
MAKLTPLLGARRKRRRLWWLVGTVTLVTLVAAAVLIVRGATSRKEFGRSAQPTSRSLPTINSPTTAAGVAPPLGGPRRSCAASPRTCGFPDATNTGVAPGTTLTPSGSIKVTQDNQVIQNLSITNGTIDISAKNVTIRNVRIVIEAPTTWAIIVRSPGSAMIDHVDVSGDDQSSRSVEYGVLSETSGAVSVRNSNLHNCSDCIQGENVTVVGNYIHDLANPPGAHVDGIQCNASCGITVTGNTIFNQYGQTSTVALFSDFGTPRNSTIANNLLAGGGYVIYGGGDNATGIHITDNRFSRLYFSTGGQFGPVAYFDPTASGTTWNGNIWDDTGAEVNK